MLNGLNSLSSNALSSFLSNGSSNSLFSSLSGFSPFDSVFTQAMNQAKTPKDKMETALAEVRFNNMNTLFGAVSGDNSPSSILGSTGSLAMDFGSVPDEVKLLEQRLGMISALTSSLQSASNQSAVIGLQNQLLMNKDLANFGTTSGSGINSLV